MSTINPKFLNVIEKVLLAALDLIDAREVKVPVADLFLCVDATSGAFSIYDDEDQLVHVAIINRWENDDREEDEFDQDVISILKAALSNMQKNGNLEREWMMKPFSINFTDADLVVKSTVFLLDDELFLIDDPLLKNLDKDLDDFLVKIFAEDK